MLDNSANRENIIHPIDHYEVPKALSRFGAAILDLALYILLSFIILTISGFILSREGSDYANENNLVSDHIKYSKLAKYEENNGYVSYSNDDLLALDDSSKSAFINELSYFYCSYLTGENIDTDLEASPDKDQQIVVDSKSYLPKDYYTVTYFNEEILGLPKEGEENKSDFFVYTDNDPSKIGAVKEELIEEVANGEGTIKRLVRDNELLKYFQKKYDEAIKVFYEQPSIKKASETMNKTNIILMLVSTLPSFAIFYIIIPLCSRFGKTLGKRFLSLIVVTDKGYQVKKWQILLRGVPILGATIYVCLINSLYYQLLLPLLLALISVGILVFNSRRRCLHDIMSGTTVIKGTKDLLIYQDEDIFKEALAIMKERDAANE